MNNTTVYGKHVTVVFPNGYTTNASFIIPERIDEYKSQQKVLPKMIELRPDGELYCTKDVFDKIPVYQWGGPTGGAQGKLWRRISGSGWDFRNRCEWELCWMGIEETDRTGETNQRFCYTEKLPLHCIVT